MHKTRNDRFGSHRAIVGMIERADQKLRRAVHHWQAKRTAAELETLSDDLLRDIGITRSEIPAVAMKVAAPAAPRAPQRNARPRAASV